MDVRKLEMEPAMIAVIYWGVLFFVAATRIALRRHL